MSFIVIILLLTVCSAFFSASETALFSLTSIERRRLLKKHAKVGALVNRLVETPRRTLIAILIGNNLVNISYGAIVSFAAMEWAGETGGGFIIAAFTLLLILLGEILPKSVAVKHNAAFSSCVAFPLNLFTVLTHPLQIAVQKIAGRIMKILLKDVPVQEKGEHVEHEILSLIQIGREEGTLQQSEARRLSRLFQLGERNVNEIMTPRTDLVAFDIQNEREDLVQLLKQYHYTHIPIYKDDLDSIQGMVLAQEVMLYSEKTLQQLLRQPHYVPESKKIDELLLEMKNLKINYALCVDEHGGTAGMVTMEDILEEVFGEIYDEYAQKEILLVKLNWNAYLVDGKILLKDFNDQLGETIEADDAETLSGFLLERFGHIPKPKETFTEKGLTFEIKQMENQRIDKILMKRGNK